MNKAKEIKHSITDHKHKSEKNVVKKAIILT